MFSHPHFDPQAQPIYIHGLEGSAQGTKGSFVLRSFGRSGPEMPAHAGGERGKKPPCFEACFQVCQEYIQQTKASVLIGSSFGGAMTMALVQHNIWRGPVVLLAPAIKHYGFDLKLPKDVNAIIIHDRSDDIIPFADSILLNESNPKQSILWESDGGHRLSTITKNGVLEKAIKQQIQYASTL